MAVARDIKGKRERIVTVINNGTTVAGQVYEAMSNAGYLDSNLVVILNDSHHSLHPKIEEGPKTSINALSSTLSRLQSSKSFRRFREVAKVKFYLAFLSMFLRLEQTSKRPLLVLPSCFIVVFFLSYLFVSKTVCK